MNLSKLDTTFSGSCLRLQNFQKSVEPVGAWALATCMCLTEVDVVNVDSLPSYTFSSTSNLEYVSFDGVVRN